MSEVNEDQKDWYIDLSDDERYDRKEEDEKQPHWTPDPTEIQKMYETLDKSQVLDISWQCPGRKHPGSDDSNTVADNDNEDGEKSPECTDFDFADEIAAPKLRRSEQLRGSARKKTTSFDSVISNMQRHRQLDQQSQQTKNN